MILCNTGPLIAVFDKAQQDHAKAVSILRDLPPQGLVTTWPCFTEAMYFLGRLAGASGQKRLWAFQREGFLKLHDLGVEELERMQALMSKYDDVPMDLADASLVAAAESLGIGTVFTFDSDFFVYRYRDREVFEIIPPRG